MKAFSIFITLWALAFIGNLRGQEFKGGFCLGLAASQIDGDSQSGYHKAGLFAGGYVQRQLQDSFSAQLEMQYIQKGAYSRLTEGRLAMHYIEVPVLAQYSKWGAQFEAGIVPGILIRAQSISDLSLEYDVDTYRQYSVSIAAGARYQITQVLGASARASYSLLPIASISNEYTTRSQFHNVLCFGIFAVLK